MAFASVNAWPYQFDFAIGIDHWCAAEMGFVGATLMVAPGLVDHCPESP